MKTAPAPRGRYSLGQRVVGVRFEPGVGDPGDLGVALQVAGDRERVGAMALHAERQRLHALQQVPGRLRRHAGAVVAQRHRAHLHGEAEIAEGLGEGEAVIGRIRLRHARELVVLPPVEAAGFDDHAAHGVAVAADELRGRVEHEVGAVIEGPAEVGRGHRVVDDQRHAVALGDLGDRLEIEHDAAGVGESPRRR